MTMGQLANEVRRRELLATHYYNAKLYIARLRTALEQIREAAELDNDPDEKIALLAREALSGTNAPPQPLAHFYDEGLHTGHPFPEYMELPLRGSEEYRDPA
jgi:hypothetical protein